jgi:hypothetical protein
LLTSRRSLTKKQDPNPDPDQLVRGMDPRIRIRIHTKISWIRNTAVPCIAAAWKIIKGWLPAAGVKKIRFLTKATMGEYVDDQNRFEVSKHVF